MKNHLGLATCFYPDSTPERWKTVREAGFLDAELDVNSNLSTDEIMTASQKIFDDLTAGGLAVTSFHLPFNDYWDISSENEAVRENAMRETIRLLHWCGEHHIGIAILHPSYEPIPAANRPARLENAIASIRTLGEAGAACGVRIAVEDLPRTCLGNCADELLLLIDNGKSGGICFDVNHLLKESHADFIAKTAPYLITTHLSDYDRQDERHWFPGEGCIDWKECYTLLQESGYEGRYLFELGEKSSPSKGAPVTPKELADRFMELIG